MDDVSFHEISRTWFRREFFRLWDEWIEPISKMLQVNTEKKDFDCILSDNDISVKESLLQFFILWANRNPLLRPCINAKWFKTFLNESEFKELRVINYNRWNEISIDKSGNVNGKLTNVAENVYENRENPFKEKIKREYYQSHIDELPLWENSRTIENIDTNLILLESEDGIRTILEGNKSAMAFYIKTLLKREVEYFPIEVYIGHLETKCQWQW